MRAPKCVAVVLAMLGGLGLRAQPVLSEINYHPPAPNGSTLEFVEIYNPEDVDVDIGGWSFASGIVFRFPPGAVIPAGGFAVVCKDRAAFETHFGAHANLFGDYEGSLDNDAEEVALADLFGAVIDVVPYDDELPWPPFADGEGPSLERRCVSAPSYWPENWVAGAFDDPTPFALSRVAECPLTRAPSPPVVLSEVHYHPLNDLDDAEEYVELTNITASPVDLSGWRFGEGIQFTFVAGTVLGPGDRIVVCRDVDRIRSLFRIDNAVGNFGGKLSNFGERLSLLDANGRLVDSMRYRDQGDWPYGADGLGRSLEKAVLDAPSDDPAAWTESRVITEGFQHVEAIGPIENLVIQRLILGIDGPGEFIVDNLVLESVEEPGVNLIQNGDFELDSIDPWLPRGNTATSEVADGVGVDGTRGLRLISTGTCGEACGSIDSVSQTFPRGALDRSLEYRLSLDFLHVSGSSAVYARLLRGVEAGFGTFQLNPGRPNSSMRSTAPPFVSSPGRYPRMPESSDPVWLSVRLRTDGAPPARVDLAWRRDDVPGSPEELIPMADDGAHRDTFAGDGVWGAEIPPQPHGAQIVYRVLVEDADGEEWIFPRPLHLTQSLPHEYWGYYVYDALPDSDLPIYHVLIRGVDPEDPQDVNSHLNCTTLVSASFAYKGELYPQIGVRWRGNTACYIQKRNFKLKFQRGRDFHGRRKLNLQGIWTDKALVREYLSWHFMDEIGAPAFETEYVRVHLNGQYHGLFLSLEHPDQRWLRRIGRDPDGCLYKAQQPPNSGNQAQGIQRFNSLEEYETRWEKETCETKDLTALAGFIDTLHSRDGVTASFMLDRTEPEWSITYQIAQVALNNIDSFAKNHFLYRDADEDRWGLIGWDMDLTFGKFFSLGVVDKFPDGERPVGTLNDCMLSDPNIDGDLNPWFTTQVDGPILHHLINRFFIAERGFFQRSYLVRLWNVLQEKFSNETLDPILDELSASLADEAAEDLARWGRYRSNPECPVPDEMAPNIEILKRQITLHRAFLMEYIRATNPAIASTPRLQFTEILYDPEGTGSALEFVELVNHSRREVDISGYAITGGIEYVFPIGTKLGDGEVIVIAKDPARLAQRYPALSGSTRIFGPFQGQLSGEGEELRVIDAGPGWPATIDRIRYGVDSPWPELRDGFSLELIDPSPGRDNDPAESWSGSRFSGGTPGSLGVPAAEFVRGDPDGSGVPSLTDAVVILTHLFLGGEKPACADAADVDDDGAILITDPVFLLNYLFLGGDTPPAPFPEPGLDPTADELGCDAGLDPV